MRIAILGIRDIWSPRDGASLRVRGLYEACKRDEHEVFYGCIGSGIEWSKLSLAGKIVEGMRLLPPHRHPYMNLQFDFDPGLDTFREMEKFKPDVLILSEIWVGGYYQFIKTAYPTIPKIVDLHNVDSVSEGAIAETKPWWIRWLNRLHVKDIAQKEREAVELSDYQWLPTLKDVNQFREKYGGNPWVVPNSLPPRSFKPTRGNLIGYVGIYNYKPNEDAALEIIQDIAPGLKGNPPLLFVGKNPTRTMSRAGEEYAGTVITSGEVANVSAFYGDMACVMLPIRTGGGSRLKVIEAALHGVPIIATEKAVEGLGFEDGIHYLRAETAGDFQKTFTRLGFEGRQIASNAYRHVSENFTWDSLELPLWRLEK